MSETRYAQLKQINPTEANYLLEQNMKEAQNVTGIMSVWLH